MLASEDFFWPDFDIAMAKQNLDKGSTPLALQVMTEATKKGK